MANIWIGCHFLTYSKGLSMAIPLSPVQKLRYLKASLNDEPAKLLAHLPSTSGNSEVAVRLLRQRYANKRMISFMHMDAIFEFRSLQQESAELLRKLLNVYLENKMALVSMGVETSVSIWVYTIAKKLDPETQRYYELQTMDQMKTFLEERNRTLESAGQPNKQLQKPKKKKRKRARSPSLP